LRFLRKYLAPPAPQDGSQLFLQNGKVVDWGDVGKVIETHEHKGEFKEA